MQKVVIFLLMFVAFIFAQSQTSVTQLANGTTTVVGSISNTPITGANALAPYLYSYYIPENAASILINLTNTNTNCFELRFFANSQLPPCYPSTYGIDGEIPTFCDFGFDDFLFTTDSYEYGVDQDSDSYLEFETNSWIYIGVATGSSYTNEICTFTLSVQQNIVCPTGNVGIVNDDEDIACQPFTAITDVNNYVYNVTNATGDFNQQWQIIVPPNTASITWHIQSDVELDLYVRQNAGASFEVNDGVAESSDNDNDNFTIDYTIYAPEAGLFYFNVVDDDSSVDSTTLLLTTSIDVCGGSSIGSNCNFTVVPITNFSLEYNAKFDSQSDLHVLNYPWRYYSFELPVFPANQNLQVTVTILNSTDDNGAYVVFTKNNFPFESDSGRVSEQSTFIETDDTPSTFFLYTPYDKLSSNAVQTNYIGIACYDGFCNTTVSFQWVSGVSTTSGTATTTTTTTSSTTSTTSGNPTTTTTTTGVTTTSTTGTTTTTTTTTSTSTSSSANITSHALTTHNLTTSFTTTTTGQVTTGIIVITTSSASALVVSLLAILAVLF